MIDPAPSDTVAYPRFSVIVPAYQSSAYVLEAVRSALDQTHPPHEVIVVDDGSTDHPEIALASVLDSIELLRRPNGGPGAARNTGLDVATGDWCVLLDADDRWMPEKLEAIAAVIQDDPEVTIVTTDAAVVDEGGGPRRQWYRDISRFEHEDQRLGILRHDFVFAGAAFRTQGALDVGGFRDDLVGVEDWDLWLRMILAGSTVALVDRPLTLYRVHDSNLSSQRVRMAEGRRRIFEAIAGRDDLQPDEKRLARRQLRSFVSVEHSVRIEQAIDDERPVRRLAARALIDRFSRRRVRVKAAAALVSPWFTRRLIHHWSGEPRSGGGATARGASGP